ncbi:predicted protein [Arabidopsis lyrata subsp. lyrata]|uniref:Predicted protein n=1 Tax=Arabidopsis lyrata subsp. lyrata TaxID=81972 RepID=D7LJF4_ARALL|nr:predicted protein [Arabidopsis lyrata subsp. lyrata]
MRGARLGLRMEKAYRAERIKRMKRIKQNKSGSSRSSGTKADLAVRTLLICVECKIKTLHPHMQKNCFFSVSHSKPRSVVASGRETRYLQRRESKGVSQYFIFSKYKIGDEISKKQQCHQHKGLKKTQRWMFSWTQSYLAIQNAPIIVSSGNKWQERLVEQALNGAMMSGNSPLEETLAKAHISPFAYFGRKLYL